MRFLPSNSLDPTAEDVLRIRIIPDQAATEYTSCRMTLGKTSQPLGEDFLDMEQKRKEAESPMWVCQDGGWLSTGSPGPYAQGATESPN